MTGAVKTIAVLSAHPGRVDALRLLLEDLVGPSRAEPGNLRYDLWADPTVPGRFVLDELYVDQAAVAAHRATRHFQNYLVHIGDLGERVAWTLDPIDVG